MVTVSEFALFNGLNTDVADIETEYFVFVECQNFRRLREREIITRKGYHEVQDLGDSSIRCMFTFVTATGVQTRYIVHGSDIYAEQD